MGPSCFDLGERAFVFVAYLATNDLKVLSLGGLIDERHPVLIVPELAWRGDYMRDSVYLLNYLFPVDFCICQDVCNRI